MCICLFYAPSNTQNYHWAFSRITSVTAEDLLVHYGGDGQAVEAVGEGFPQLDVESAFTCKMDMRVSQDIWQHRAL